MATVVVSPTLPLQTRNWSDPATWVGGVLPAVGDDVVANATSGDLYVNAINRTCLTINFTNFTNTFRIENGITLNITGTAITLGSGMTFTPGTTGILSTSAQAAITIAFASITIPNLTIGKSTSGGSHAVTISGTAPTVNRLVTFGVVFVTLTGPALTITNSIVLNQRISSGPAIIFLGTVTISGASLLNTGFTVPASSTLIIGSNVNVAGNITFAVGSNLTPSTFTVTIQGLCTLDSNAVTWYNISVSNPSTSAITLTSNLNISNNLFFNSAASSTTITSAIVRTITVQGNVTSDVNYITSLVLNNITLDLTGRGTFAVARITAGASTTNTININTSDPVGYVIGSSAFTGANAMRLPVLSFNLVGTSVASAFVGTTLLLSGTTINTNRSGDTFGGSNPIYTSIQIDTGTTTIITDTTCTGNLVFTTVISGVTANGAKILFGGNLVGGAFNVQGTSTLEFTGSNPASWIAGTYLNNIVVNKIGGAVVTAAAGNITWGSANAVLTLNSTVNFSTNSNTFILSGTPLTINNSSTSQFFNMTVPNIRVLNINNNTTPILGTLALAGSATFAGTHGWTCGTLTCSLASSTIILQSGVTYTTTTSVTMLGTNAGRITMRSNAPTVSYAIWTLQNPASQSMVYVNAQGIDSNAGMTIYSFQGVILTSLPALNWYNGASQGTKAFTFVN
jgi:hypothetical protein